MEGLGTFLIVGFVFWLFVKIANGRNRIKHLADPKCRMCHGDGHILSSGYQEQCPCVKREMERVIHQVHMTDNKLKQRDIQVNPGQMTSGTFTFEIRDGKPVSTSSNLFNLPAGDMTADEARRLEDLRQRSIQASSQQSGGKTACATCGFYTCRCA